MVIYKPLISQALVAHSCNPSFPGGRDQKDRDSKPAWAKSLWDPLSKKKNYKNGLVEWLKLYALISNLQYHKNKKETINKTFIVLLYALQKTEFKTMMSCMREDTETLLSLCANSFNMKNSLCTPFHQRLIFKNTVCSLLCLFPYYKAKISSSQRSTVSHKTMLGNEFWKLGSTYMTPVSDRSGVWWLTNVCSLNSNDNETITTHYCHCLQIVMKQSCQKETLPDLLAT
jgi:hypothetical protein